MSKKAVSNIKLGVFVVAALAFLIILLYMIGKNKNMFGSTFEVKVHFGNVQGLTPGNNVRYAGIHVGTVKDINILDDTRIEVVVLIENDMKKFIRKNALVTIATDGLMGNKVLNITPVGEPAALIEEGDILRTQPSVSMDEMVNTLSGSNSDLSVITAELKRAMLRINSSTALWALLSDSTIPRNLSASLANVRSATAKANTMVDELNSMVTDVKSGKGSLGTIITDTSLAENLNLAILRIKLVAGEAETLAKELSAVARGLKNDIDSGKGTVHALLKDTAMVHSLNTSLNNIQRSTQNFNEVMEGMKHSFLVRGYFRRLEKKKARAEGLQKPK